jgi:hypothetical protein
MSMSFRGAGRHVSKGDPIKIGSQTWNRILDAAAEHEANILAGNREGLDGAERHPQLAIEWYNNSPTQTIKFGAPVVYGIVPNSSFPVIDPAADPLDGMLFNTRAQSSSSENIGVAIEDIPPLSSGRVAVAGVCVLLVNQSVRYSLNTSLNTHYARPNTSGGFHLSPVGSFRVISPLTASNGGSYLLAVFGNRKLAYSAYNSWDTPSLTLAPVVNTSGNEIGQQIQAPYFCNKSLIPDSEYLVTFTFSCDATTARGIQLIHSFDGISGSDALIHVAGVFTPLAVAGLTTIELPLTPSLYAGFSDPNTTVGRVRVRHNDTGVSNPQVIVKYLAVREMAVGSARGGSMYGHAGITGAVASWDAGTLGTIEASSASYALATGGTQTSLFWQLTGPTPVTSTGGTFSESDLDPGEYTLTLSATYTVSGFSSTDSVTVSLTITEE